MVILEKKNLIRGRYEHDKSEKGQFEKDKSEKGQFWKGTFLKRTILHSENEKGQV